MEKGLTAFVSMFFMASALGMDAFSMSLGIGLKKIRSKRILSIGLIVGAFHIIMPFFGLLLGKFISIQIGEWTTLLSGILLFLIGAHMFFQAFQIERNHVFSPNGIGPFLFAFTVSLDSFSVGLSLGIREVETLIMIILFGVTSMCLTWLGLAIARKVTGYLGKYGEMFGGSILAAFGLFFIFH